MPSMTGLVDLNLVRSSTPCGRSCRGCPGRRRVHRRRRDQPGVGSGQWRGDDPLCRRKGGRCPLSCGAGEGGPGARSPGDGGLPPELHRHASQSPDHPRDRSRNLDRSPGGRGIARCSPPPADPAGRFWRSRSWPPAPQSSGHQSRGVGSGRQACESWSNGSAGPRSGWQERRSVRSDGACSSWSASSVAMVQCHVERAAHRLASLRVFEDEEGHMNLGLDEIAGEALVVSQFTLAGSIRGEDGPTFPAPPVPRRRRAGRRPGGCAAGHGGAGPHRCVPRPHGGGADQRRTGDLRVG